MWRRSKQSKYNFKFGMRFRTLMICNPCPFQLSNSIYSSSFLFFSHIVDVLCGHGLQIRAIVCRDISAPSGFAIRAHSNYQPQFIFLPFYFFLTLSMYCVGTDCKSALSYVETYPRHLGLAAGRY
jgi:hypothetical protein